MKIYLIYDEGPSELHHKLAITLPSKWLEQSADKVKELFVERYNKKFPDNQLDDEDLVLAVKDESPFTNRSVKHLGTEDTPMTVLLDAAGITGGAGAALRDVWNKADLGVHAANYTTTVATHDTLLLIATPQKAKAAVVEAA